MSVLSLCTSDIDGTLVHSPESNNKPRHLNLPLLPHNKKPNLPATSPNPTILNIRPGDKHPGLKLIPTLPQLRQPQPILHTNLPNNLPLFEAAQPYGPEQAVLLDPMLAGPGCYCYLGGLGAGACLGGDEEGIGC